MNIRADEYIILTRGYNLDRNKLLDLSENLISSTKAVAKNEKELNKLNKAVDLSKIDQALFDCYDRQARELRSKNRTALANYVAYYGGDLYKSIREAYKDSDKPQCEIDASFLNSLKHPTIHPLDDENIFSFPDCNTPADIFEKVKRDILDRMATAIPRPLENIVTHISDQMIIFHDKGTTEIFEGKMKAGEKREIKLNRSGRDRMVREIEFVNQEFDETLTQFGLKEGTEKGVAGALCSLWDDNTRVFSLQTIATMLGGNDPDADSKASKQSLQEIKEILRKLGTWTIIDYSQEAIAYKDKFMEVLEPDGKLYKYEGPLFHVDIETTAKLNGTITHEAVTISKEPILWKLAKAKAQFTKVPLSVFRTPGNLTANKIELQMYLVERLTQMKRMKKKNTPLSSLTIKWDTLLKRTGHAGAKPSAKAKVKERALSMLDTWKQAGELLLDYTTNEEAIYIALEEPHLKIIDKQRTK